MKLTTYLLLHGMALTSYASTTEVTANFDNLTASALPVLGSGVGTYEGITYNSFSLVDNADETVGGVATHTEPNAILTSSEQQGTNGTPSLTIAKPYSSLGLINFWFGCAAHTGEAVAGLALQCTITVAAFESSSDEEVALASFTFTPPAVSVTTVPMIEAVLPSTFLLPGIEIVTIIQDDPTTEALLVDSISYYLTK